MNCKQGDLAIIIKSQAGNEGKIVRCLELLPGYKSMGRSYLTEEHDSWLTDNTNLMGWDGSQNSVVPDSYLKPLRDPGDDAKDEMLRPLPVAKPKPITVE